MKYKTYEFAFLMNIMYSHHTIRQVRWWNKIFGFSGMFELSTVKVTTDLGAEEAKKIAKKEFEESGYFEHIMGERF